MEIKKTFIGVILAFTLTACGTTHTIPVPQTRMPEPPSILMAPPPPLETIRAN